MSKEIGSDSVLFPEIEAWTEPVDGAELLDEKVGAIKRFLILPEGAPEAMALWAVHAHAHDAHPVSPLLVFTSPEKQCGKSNALRVLQALVPRPLPFANITPAALFRTVEKWKPTLLIDEADSYLQDSNELRGILNSGHQRDLAQLIRTVGDVHEPRVFRTWGPKAVAVIGRLPDTLEDRSIVIPMRRRRASEAVDRLRLDREIGLPNLARQATRWVNDNENVLCDADPAVPGELSDRGADNWRPLLAIADAAGDHWPETARRVARALSSSNIDENSDGVMLLADIKSIFKKRGDQRLPSADIINELIEMEGRPWGEWRRGQPITAHGLARLLKPYGIAPATIRTEMGTSKGYLRSAFEDAFSRYVPNDLAQTVTTSQPTSTAGLSEFQGVTDGDPVTDGMGPKSLENKACDDVTDGADGGSDEVCEWAG